MLRETATGIEFLHSLGVVHCDIKPRNILLTGDNQVKVSDMGLSKKLEEEETSFTFSTNAPSGDGGCKPHDYCWHLGCILPKSASNDRANRRSR